MQNKAEAQRAWLQLAARAAARAYLILAIDMNIEKYKRGFCFLSPPFYFNLRV